ncbi:hypothetical protein [Xanthobacter autotrophicus]|uniref:hypothetical protein n=1 Tax=Xanthobacter autotrophicus TaxID=280 RepID=UPI003727B374
MTDPRRPFAPTHVPNSAKAEQSTTFGTGGPAARAAIERAVSPAVADAIAVAHLADGAGAAIETARAVMRAAARELAHHAGPAAAAEEAYRAADDILSFAVRDA